MPKPLSHNALKQFMASKILFDVVKEKTMDDPTLIHNGAFNQMVTYMSYLIKSYLIKNPNAEVDDIRSMGLNDRIARAKAIFDFFDHHGTSNMTESTSMKNLNLLVLFLFHIRSGHHANMFVGPHMTTEEKENLKRAGKEVDDEPEAKKRRLEEQAKVLDDALNDVIKDLPVEIWVDIINAMPSLNELLDLRTLNRDFNQVITKIIVTRFRHKLPINDVSIILINSVDPLLSLSSSVACNLTDMSISQLSHLQSLNLSERWCKKQNITDNSVMTLTSLQFLNLCKNSMITDKGIIPLITLKSLDLSLNEMITDNALKSLSTLHHLQLNYNHAITDASVSTLVQLRSLDLSDNTIISDTSIIQLKYLETLRLNNQTYFDNQRHYDSFLSHGITVTDVGLRSCKSLTQLSLNNNDIITDDALLYLVQLRTLNLEHNSMITDHALSTLTNLTSLNISFNMVITDASVSLLTQLTYLNISKAHITPNALDDLRHLSTLVLYYSDINVFRNLPDTIKLEYQFSQ